MTVRLDNYLHQQELASSRSQASSMIKLGGVRVNGVIVKKPGHSVKPTDKVTARQNKYVSRAALKLSSVAKSFQLSFSGKVVLDVGSSTGGFTDYALQHGAKKVFAVDVGTNQLHPTLRNDARIELHEKTDIRDFALPKNIDIVLADVSFISLRKLLPHIHKGVGSQTQVVVMVKPQFEADSSKLLNNGVVKNNQYRRKILKDFEQYLVGTFAIDAKQDSSVPGEKGNVERFYLLRPIQ